MIKHWTKTGSRPIGHYRIFDLRFERKVSPRNGSELEAVILDCPDWVHVIPVTPDNHLVMVEQYRHGTDTVELEVPGGMIDRSDASPVEAAIRELREETGYEGDNAKVIGTIYPNPAFMTNTCHTVLIENCRLKHPVEFDHGEDLLTRRVAVNDIPRLIGERGIRHSLVVVGLYYFELWRRGLERPGT